MLKLGLETTRLSNRFGIPSILLQNLASTPRKRSPINKLLNKKKHEYKEVSIYAGMSLRQLSESMGKTKGHIFECLSTIKNVHIPGRHFDKEIDDIFILQEIVRRSGMKPVHIARPREEEDQLTEIFDLYERPPPDPSVLKRRPPVIAILGHVDHGKTTLLDALRKSTIAQNEAGGITQHIGAFRVVLPNSESITVLDTPGHAAFKSLRARGANATDVAVLIVAGDDGIMNQTLESIELLREAKCPIVVAITMTDRPNYNLKRVKKQLTEVGLIPEDTGGDTQVIPICAPKGEGLKELVEAIVAEAELVGIVGDSTGPVEGYIIESTVATNRGGMKAATILVERGTLGKGDVLVAGTAMCRVKLMLDDKERQLSEVKPGEAAVVFGWRDMPPAAELLLEADNEPQAGKVIAYRKKKLVEEKALLDSVTAEEQHRIHQEQYRKERRERWEQGYFRRKPKSGQRQPEERTGENDGKPKLNIVIKADTDGSIEALLGILAKYHSQKCDLAIVSYGIGPVSPSDIDLATPFDAVIVSFNAKISPQMKEVMQSRGVHAIHHNIIYRLLDDIKDELTSRLPPKIVEEKIGEAAVLQSFFVTENKKKSAVAGSRVLSGELTRNDLYRITRNGEHVFEGHLASLRHFKQDVPVIPSGQECGLRFEGDVVPEQGDSVICFRKRSVADEIDWKPHG